MSFDTLINDIKHCALCANKLPLPPRPIIQASKNARVLLIGQAPGLATHNKNLPFKDASGERLRAWLEVTESDFYNPQRFAIMPMAFCYPGKNSSGSGDKPPPAICSKTWHDDLLREMQNIKMTILIGRYACNRYLPMYNDLTQAIINQSIDHSDRVVLPHPSPRNNIWLKKNPWFETKTLPILRQRLQNIFEN